MKIRTRILTAVLATATAFSCALTASAAAPTITLDNSTMPAMAKDGVATATLTLKSSDFEGVTGAKINITLPEGITLDSAEITDDTWVKGQDYEVKGNNTVTLVNVFNLGGDTATDLSLNLNVTVSGAEIKDYPITVTGEYADTKVDKVYTIAEASNGTLVISKAEKAFTSAEATTEIASLDTEQYFIPYGGVYYKDANDKYQYCEKTGLKEFTLPETGEVSVLKCKLPAADKDVTTFGLGTMDGDKNLPEINYKHFNALQFGSYAKKADNVGFGTLLIMGDYNAFKTAIDAATDEAALRAIVAKYDKTVDEKDNVNPGDSVTFTKDTNKITVKKVAQTKKMWSDNKYLQYAVRLYKLVPGRIYTSVGYSFDGTTYNFSAEIQSRENTFEAD